MEINFITTPRGTLYSQGQGKKTPLAVGVENAGGRITLHISDTQQGGCAVELSKEAAFIIAAQLTEATANV